MKNYKNSTFEGERALYDIRDAKIENCIFQNGESPIKECSNLEVYHSDFRWKYPIWYSRGLKLEDIRITVDGRAGMWYLYDCSFKEMKSEAPKGIRRCRKIIIEDSEFTKGDETLWESSDIRIKNVRCKGDYFGLNCSDMTIDNLYLDGNYSFDGAKNVVIKNSTILGRDCFWNSENITLENCTLKGAYFAWNSKNIKLIHCRIESLQGLCYMDDLTLIDCDLTGTDLAFELCAHVDAEVNSPMISIKNPISGKIRVKQVEEIIFDRDDVDPSKTEIVVG